jgi:hypothetical protein
MRRDYSRLRTPQGKEEVSVQGAAGAAGGGAAGTDFSGTIFQAPWHLSDACRPEQDADQTGNLCVPRATEGIAK